MFLEGGVHCSALIVHAVLLFVLLEDAFFLHGWLLLWNSFRSYRIGRENKWGGRDVIILLGQKDKTKVTILSAVEGALGRRCVFCNEFLHLLDGGVLGIVRVLG